MENSLEPFLAKYQYSQFLLVENIKSHFNYNHRKLLHIIVT